MLLVWSINFLFISKIIFYTFISHRLGEIRYLEYRNFLAILPYVWTCLLKICYFHAWHCFMTSLLSNTLDVCTQYVWKEETISILWYQLEVSWVQFWRSQKVVTTTLGKPCQRRRLGKPGLSHQLQTTGIVCWLEYVDVWRMVELGWGSRSL